MDPELLIRTFPTKVKIKTTKSCVCKEGTKCAKAMGRRARDYEEGRAGGEVLRSK
jgi:hypothetical protein